MYVFFFKDINDIWLIGGRKVLEGCIEVKYNGIWGSICF